MSAVFTDIDVPFALAVEHVTQVEFDAAGLSHWLTVEEQARYDELKLKAVAKRSRQWLLGRYAAKVACRRWLQGQGLEVSEWRAIQVGNTENGMPRLTIHGSDNSPTLGIAHSGEEAIAAVADPGNQVGVDIENRILHSELHALSKRICNETEYQRWFTGLAVEMLSERFRQLWLAKEATAKCTGKGLQWRPGTFEVVRLSEREAIVLHGDEQYVVHYENRRIAFASRA